MIFKKIAVDFFCTNIKWESNFLLKSVSVYLKNVSAKTGASLKITSQFRNG